MIVILTLYVYMQPNYSYTNSKYDIGGKSIDLTDIEAIIFSSLPFLYDMLMLLYRLYYKVKSIKKGYRYKDDAFVLQMCQYIFAWGITHLKDHL